MSRKTDWQLTTVRCLCALSLILCSSRAYAIVLDDGTIHTPASVASTVATMPLIGSGSETNFTLGNPQPNNLGSFDIVLVPSAALSANGPALAAFNRAAQNWEAWIADPITVTINADFSLLGSGILGSTSSVTLNAGYTTI